MNNGNFAFFYKKIYEKLTSNSNSNSKKSLATTFRQIKELRKQFTSEQTQQRNAASIKEQKALILTKQVRKCKFTCFFLQQLQQF